MREIETAKAVVARARSARLQESAKRRRVISTSQNIDYESDDSETSPTSQSHEHYTEGIENEVRLSLDDDVNNWGDNHVPITPECSRLGNLPDWRPGSKEGRSALPNSTVSSDLEIAIRSEYDILCNLMNFLNF